MKRTTNDIVAGLERIGSAITVLGTYVSNYKCENKDSVVTAESINDTFDLLADYADLLKEQLIEIDCSCTGDL